MGASLTAQFFIVILGIIIPRLVLVNLGSEANGLLNSITTALSYLSLLEAGVGTATLQALYRPVAEKDRTAVSRIMSATHYFYRRTGMVYLVIVIVFACGFTAFIDTSIPRADVFLVVLLSGLSGVLSYFFQGKFRILLDAEGKSYITTNIGTVVHTCISLGKAGVLLAGGNVVTVQSVYFLINLVQMLIFLIYMKRNYGWVNYREKPDFEAISQKNAVLVHQISGLIFNNTDVLVLTFFTSLKSVSVYSLYALIFGMIKSVTVSIDGFLYALGQSYHDRERFLRMFDVYEVYKMAITSALFCITRILILPFLALYTRGVSDVNYLDPYISWLFAVFYLLHCGRQSSGNLINIAQKFEDTKWRSVLESAINLSVSIVLTARMGIYGVLLGTIAALLYRTNDMIIYAARILKRSPWITYRRWLINLAIFAGVTGLVSWMNPVFDSYPKLIAGGAALGFTVLPLFLAIGLWSEPEVLRFTVKAVIGWLAGKKK